MAKILVIPDVHLKPHMFRRAAELMRDKVAEKAISLGDLADDHEQKRKISLYEETYDAAINFAKEFPDTLWCCGNHDYCYLADRWVSGYSSYAHSTVIDKIMELIKVLPEKSQYAFIHKIDNVLFLHAGLCDYYAKTYCSSSAYNNPDKIVTEINQMNVRDLWEDYSPIWFRPQYSKEKMYKPRKLLQVVGHTPVKKPTKKGNVVSCDAFATQSDGKPYGSQEFTIVDTVTWECQYTK